MQEEQQTQPGIKIESYPIDLTLDTARWTSPAYNVKFGQISEMSTQQDHNSFRVSACGLSGGLSHLLNDYSQFELKSALDSLIINQNAHMLMMLNQAIDSENFSYEMLDQIFVTIDTELFLPRGLRMHVTCITNIIQVDAKSGMLDKFVAVLDPGEARQYIQERRDMIVQTRSKTVH